VHLADSTKNEDESNK